MIARDVYGGWIISINMISALVIRALKIEHDMCA